MRAGRLEQLYLFGAALAALSLSTACESKQPATDGAGASRAVQPEGLATPEAPAKPPKPSLPALSEDILAATRAVAAVCEFDESGSPGKCQGGELVAYKKLLGKNRMKAYAPLVTALGDGDQRVRYLAAFAFEDQVAYFISDADKRDYTIQGDDNRVNPIDVEVTRTFLKHVSAFDPDKDQMAISTIRMAVEAGTQAGLDDEVRALLKGVDPQKSEANMWVYYMGTKGLMRYGRMRFFEDAKQMLEHPIEQLRSVAFDAPMQMSSWGAGESDTICRWASALLKEDVPIWNAGPARLMLRCNDANTWRNVLLDETTRRYSEGALKRPFTTALCRICAPPIPGQFPAAGKTVCDRGEALFLKLTVDDKLDPAERAHLVECMPEQWPSAATLAHMEQLKTSSDAVVAQSATRAVAKLTAKEPTRARRSTRPGMAKPASPVAKP